MRGLKLFVTTAVVAVGCAPNRPEPKDVRHKLYVRTGHARAAPAEGTQTPASECPRLPSAAGTRIEVAEIPEGAALVLTTRGDVAELRRRVRSMADMHDTVQGMVGVRSTEAVERPNLVRAQASVEEVEGGARLLYVTDDHDEDHLALLRLEAREHADLMLQGRCPTVSVRPGRFVRARG